MTTLLESVTAMPDEFVPASTLDSSASDRPATIPCGSATSLNFKVSRWPVLWPLVGLLIASACLAASDLDLWISSCFHDAATGHWTWGQAGWSMFLYRHGTLFPMAIAIGGLVVFLYGLIGRQPESIFRGSLFLVLVMVVGPGLTVNSLLKQYYGRPRPNQIENFGGTHSYTSIATPGASVSRNSSFPSGHAAIAFYLMAPAFIVGDRRPRLARGLLTFGILYGIAMGFARIVQGGHFASDILWSAGILYFTCVIFAFLILRVRSSSVTSLWTPAPLSFFRGRPSHRCAN